MPIKRAAYKAIRSDRKKRLKNIATVSRIKTLTKKLNGLIASKNKDEIKKALQNFVSAMDKAAQKGIVHRKNASRKIARISSKVAQVLK
jgi:small subunit ribosomal protein S20